MYNPKILWNTVVSMSSSKIESERQTAADKVFELLHEEIMSLQLMPGAKISEADIAHRFNMSRQPVRDAFNRLAWLDLVLIRPQRATIVRGFSEKKIAEARFVRLSVELEVIRDASQNWNSTFTEKSMQILQQQMTAIREQRWVDFHALDFDFHAQLCQFAGRPCVVNIIQSCRQQTDRLLNLSFKGSAEGDECIDDHRQVIMALDKHDLKHASNVLRAHFAHLDLIVERIRAAHSNFFY